MGCLTPERRAQLEEELNNAIALRDALVAGAAAAASKGIESFSLDTGIAKQSTKNYNIKDLSMEIRNLNADISRYRRILNGTGLMNIDMRRLGN